MEPKGARLTFRIFRCSPLRLPAEGHAQRLRWVCGIFCRPDSRQHSARGDEFRTLREVSHDLRAFSFTGLGTIEFASDDGAARERQHSLPSAAQNFRRMRWRQLRLTDSVLKANVGRHRRKLRFGDARFAPAAGNFKMEQS